MLLLLRTFVCSCRARETKAQPAQVWVVEHHRAEEAPCVAHRQEEPPMGTKRAVWGQQVKGFQGPRRYNCQQFYAEAFRYAADGELCVRVCMWVSAHRVHCMHIIAAASEDTPAVDPASPATPAGPGSPTEEGLQVPTESGGDRGGANSLAPPGAASLGDSTRSTDSTNSSLNSRRINAHTRSRTTTRGKLGRMSWLAVVLWRLKIASGGW